MVAVKRDDQALVAVHDAVDDELEVATAFKNLEAASLREAGQRALGEGEVRIRYDSESDILYIDVAPGRKARDTQPLDDDILVDLDEEGNIVGVEVWNASKTIEAVEQLVEKARRLLEAAAEAKRAS
jgi:uncharacterized protein YuzE